MKLANFINGEKQPPINGAYLDSYQPATGKVHCYVPDSDEADVDQAVAAARAAFPAWSATSTAERARIMNRIADLLESRLQEFAEAESRDQGKPVSLARTVDIPRAVYNLRFFAGAILHHEDSCTMMDGALNYTNRKPLGVAGLISPWNLPLYLLTWKIAPALAAGNCAVAKPSEMTSLTAHMFADVMAEAGLPPGVCNLVMGLGGRAGAALVKHPHVPLISFTGGTATAVQVQTDAAPHFKKLSLELGGKNPALIFDDADLKACIPTAVRSAFANQGEICLCASRIFVQRGIYDQFLEQFIARAKGLVVGDPSSRGTHMGALVSQEHRAKVISYIELAKEEGGEVVLGGGIPKLPDQLAGGYFLEPTILTGLDPYKRVMQEEIFGPVVAITPFDTDEEAVTLANCTRYGLSATLWTTNVKRAHRISQSLDAGVVWVNTWLMRDLRTPFGGMKASGIGREGGRHSLDFYTEAQNICIYTP